MENLISLVNKLQRACTTLGDHGEAASLPTLWDSLPSIAVVGGQVCRLSSFFIFVDNIEYPYFISLIIAEYTIKILAFCLHMQPPLDK